MEHPRPHLDWVDGQASEKTVKASPGELPLFVTLSKSVAELFAAECDKGSYSV
jgi:hypothetical protein